MSLVVSRVPRRRLFCGSLLGVVLSCATAACVAAEPTDLAADQEGLARKFSRLESLAKRIAELSEADDPGRAEQLRAAIRKSQDLALPERFEAIVTLLEQEQLAAASKDQTVLSGQLQTLLRLLLADPREARDEAERKRLREALKELRRLIQTQQDLRSRPTEDADADADRQASIEKNVGRLRGELRPTGPGGAPSSSPPSGEQPSVPGPAPPDAQGGPAPGPSASPDDELDQEPTPTDRAAERLAAAEQQMRQATERLRKAERDLAEQRQTAAQRELEQAKEEIERALRQLREEELKRRLKRLATRLRRMLSEQVDIKTLTRQTEEDRPDRGRRATAIAAAGLANRETALVKAADNALLLLAEDGASIAFPETIQQIREDIVTVAGRLKKSQLAAVTQRLEEEVIVSLEEAIGALDQTLADLDEREQSGRQGEPGGQPGEPPLVDKLAELRMIRATQARISRRTKFWDDLRQTGEADRAEAAEALEKAAARQTSLIRALRRLSPPARP